MNNTITEIKNTVYVKSLQSCQTLCNPMDYSPAGSSVNEIFQARLLEWVAMPSSRGSSQPKDWTHISFVPALASRFFPTNATWEAQSTLEESINRITEAEEQISMWAGR